LRGQGKGGKDEQGDEYTVFHRLPPKWTNFIEALNKFFFIGYTLTMVIEQIVIIPADRRLNLDLPETFPCGKARLSITTDSQPAFDTRFAGAVSPALFGKGEIKGDIVGPFDEEWEPHT
jgi:hypothetical protein